MFKQVFPNFKKSLMLCKIPPNLTLIQSIKFPLSFFYCNSYKNFSSSSTASSQSTSFQKSKQSQETLIYEYKNVVRKLRTFFWSNMFYIYGNSILFHLELFEPTIGYFHGLMLSLSLVLGWGCFSVIGSVSHKTIYRIYKFNDYLGRPKYRVVYLSFYKVFILIFKKGRKRRNFKSKRFD